MIRGTKLANSSDFRSDGVITCTQKTAGTKTTRVSKTDKKLMRNESNKDCEISSFSNALRTGSMV